MKHLFNILVFIFISFLSIGQGIPPNKLQGSPYENGVLLGKDQFINEGDTSFIYKHAKLDSIIASIIASLPKGVDSIWYNFNNIYYSIEGNEYYIDLPEFLISLDRGPDNALTYYNSLGGSGEIPLALVPTSGSEGQTIRKTLSAYEWQDYENIDSILVYPQQYYASGLTDSLGCNVLRIRKVENTTVTNEWLNLCTPSDTSLIKNIVTNSLDTLTLPRDSTTVLGGTGISVWESPTNTYNIQNTAPDQTVALTPTGIVSVSGAYPNFTINATEVDGDPNNEKQALSQSFTGSTEATYSLNLGGGSVKDTTGFMRLETMFSTAGSRTYRYKSNLGAILGITEDPLLGGNSNIEVLRTGNQLTWGLRKDNASNGQIYKYNGTAWALSSDATGLTNIFTTLPITTSGGATPTLAINTATGSNSGALSAADWTTFNNKIGGSGSSGRVAIWTGSNTQSYTDNLRSESAFLHTGYSDGIHIDASSATYASGVKFRNHGYAHCTFGMKGSSFVFSNTSSNHLALWPSPTDRLAIDMTSGIINIPNLAGTGTRLVTSTTTGNLGNSSIDISSIITGSGTTPRLAFWSGPNTLTSTANLRSESNYLFTGYSEGIHINGANASYASGVKFRNSGYAHCTFGMKGSSFVFSNTSSNELTLWPSPTDRLAINMSTGVVNIPNLAGTGNRLVLTSGTGDLSPVALGTGLSFSGTTLNLPAGVTTGNFLRWNGTTWTSDVPIFSFGVTGSTTNISCNSTMTATVNGGTNIVTSNSGGAVTVSTNNSYAQMRLTTTTQSMTAGSVYKIAFGTPISNGVITASDANDRFTVSETGVYKIHYDFGTSYVLGGSNSILTLIVKKNASLTDIFETETVSVPAASNAPLTIAKTALVSLTAGDYLELYGSMLIGTVSVNYGKGNMIIERID